LGSAAGARWIVSHIRKVLAVALLIAGVWLAYRLQTNSTYRDPLHAPAKPLAVTVRCSQEAGGLLLTNEDTETWMNVVINVNASDVFHPGFIHRIASVPPGKLTIIAANELINSNGETMEAAQHPCKTVDIYADVSGKPRHANFVSE
jgi:hypothetical protein